MLREPTIEKLHALRLRVMASTWIDQDKSPDTTALSFDERLALLVDAEMLARENARLTKNLRDAKLRIADACIEGIDFPRTREIRPIDRHIADVAGRSGGVYALDQSPMPDVDRAARRMRDLERMGLASPAGNERWAVAPNLLEELSRRQEHAPARHRLLMHKQPLSLQAQVRHPGPVWLDRVEAASLALHGFGADVTKWRSSAAKPPCGTSALTQTTRRDLRSCANSNGGRWERNSPRTRGKSSFPSARGFAGGFSTPTCPRPAHHTWRCPTESVSSCSRRMRLWGRCVEKR
jgi:hypothetical protein